MPDVFQASAVLTRNSASRTDIPGISLTAFDQRNQRANSAVQNDVDARNANKAMA
jgi:hypothetical protein